MEEESVILDAKAKPEKSTVSFADEAEVVENRVSVAEVTVDFQEPDAESEL